MADFTQSTWRDRLPRLSTAERAQHLRDLARGIHRVTDDDGRPLDLSGGPTTCETAPLIEISKDKAGRTKFKPVEPEQTKVEPRGEIDMERFRGQMKLAESFKGEDKQKAIKAIYLEHLGIEI